MATLFVFIFILIGFGLTTGWIQEQAELDSRNQPVIFAEQMLAEHRAQMDAAPSDASGENVFLRDPLTFTTSQRNGARLRVFTLQRQGTGSQVEVLTIGWTRNEALRSALASEIKRRAGTNMDPGVIVSTLTGGDRVTDIYSVQQGEEADQRTALNAAFVNALEKEGSGVDDIPAYLDFGDDNDNRLQPNIPVLLSSLAESSASPERLITLGELAALPDTQINRIRNALIAVRTSVPTAFPTGEDADIYRRAVVRNNEALASPATHNRNAPSTVDGLRSGLLTNIITDADSNDKLTGGFHVGGSGSLGGLSGYRPLQERTRPPSAQEQLFDAHFQNFLNILNDILFVDDAT